MSFDEIPEEGQALHTEIAPILDEKRAAERLEKLLNMLASDNGYEPAVAAAKIASLARGMGLTVSQAVRKLFTSPEPVQPVFRAEPNPFEAAAYTPSGVPRNKAKVRAGDHHLSRLREAYNKIKDTDAVRELSVSDLENIGYLLELNFDWQMSKWESKFCKLITKRMLQEDADPLI